ncbi:MAG: hypothetical protein ACRC5T_11140 [Cetobacterium sp.]
MKDLTPQKALEILYSATRQLAVRADTHKQLSECASIVQEALTPKVEPKKDNTRECC